MFLSLGTSMSITTASFFPFVYHRTVWLVSTFLSIWMCNSHMTFALLISTTLWGVSHLYLGVPSPCSKHSLYTIPTFILHPATVLDCLWGILHGLHLVLSACSCCLAVNDTYHAGSGVAMAPPVGGLDILACLWVSFRTHHALSTFFWAGILAYWT